MQVEEHVERVGAQARAAAALGDERTQQIAEALAGAVASSVRLALIDVASAVAADVTAALFDVPGASGASVAVHLDGDDLRIVVTPPVDGTAEPVPPPDDSETTARISLRLPDALKADVEQAAAREGLSINAWLVRAIAAAARTPSSRRGNTTWPAGGGKGGHRITGWVTG